MTMSARKFGEDMQRTKGWDTEMPVKETSTGNMQQPFDSTPLKSDDNLALSHSEIWLSPHLHHSKDTENLDHQQPATLFFLGMVKDVQNVIQVFVEELEDGSRKHWTVMNKRDYDLMDRIYDIEEDTLSRFPGADLSFRVTLLTKEGPSISSKATKIYDAQ